jgi:YHS domain-containing protein
MSESAEIKDPVCGKAVDPLRARAVGIYGGVTHYFCSAECKARFVDPRRADADAAPPPGGVERRWKDETRDQTGEWFEKGAAAPPPVTGPVERFTDLDRPDAPLPEQPLSPSLMIEVEKSKKPSSWPWVMVALLLTASAVWFFGLRP